MVNVTRFRHKNILPIEVAILLCNPSASCGPLVVHISIKLINIKFYSTCHLCILLAINFFSYKSMYIHRLLSYGKIISLPSPIVSLNCRQISNTFREWRMVHYVHAVLSKYLLCANVFAALYYQVFPIVLWIQ